MADGTLPAEAFRPAPRIAVLVDADNVQSWQIEFSVDEVAKHGRVMLKRAFGRLNSIRAHEAMLMQLGFTAEITLPRVRNGKNAADLLLAQYAMRLAERQAVDTVVLVTSDSDIAVVARGLTECGVRTAGFGGANTPEVLREACTSFTQFPQQVSAGNGQGTMPDVASGDEAKLRRVIDNTLGRDGRARAQLVGTRINLAFGGRYKAHFGVSTLSQLLGRFADYEMAGEGTEREVVKTGRT